MPVYIDTHSVIAINKMVTEHYGQPHVVIADANLEHALESTMRYGEHISDETEKLLKKAAFMLYHLAYDAHAFSDGNKRTALLATQLFLILNSHPIALDSEEKQVRLAKLMKETAEGKQSVSSIYKWLKSVST